MESVNSKQVERRWGFFIGVNYYQDKNIPDLSFCVDDAQALSKSLTDNKTFEFSPDCIKLLLSIDECHQEALRLTIFKKLYELASYIGENDLFLFYFSGHGIVLENEPYLIPSDAETEPILTESLISFKRVLDIIKTQVRAHAKIIILDTCYLNGGERDEAINQLDQVFLKSVEKILANIEGVSILASSSQNKPSLEDRYKRHGSFSNYILQALRDKAVNENNDDYLTVQEIFRYTAEKARNQFPQRPIICYEGAGEIVLVSAPVNSVVEECNNPIQRVFPIAVKLDEDFYNRREEIKTIKEILAFTSDILVILQGERCVGKTSLINRARLMIEEEPWRDRKFTHFTIEPGSLSSVEELAREIWLGLIFSLDQKSSSIRAETDKAFVYKGYNEFAHQLEKISAQFPGITFVIFIDEFDTIVQEVNEVAYKQMVGLIHYLLEYAKFPLLVVITAFRDLPQSYRSSLPFRKVLIHPFSRISSDEMICSLMPKTIHLSEEILASFFSWTGGNPHLIKLFLYKYYQEASNGVNSLPLTIEILQQMAKLSLLSAEADDLFKDIYYLRLDDFERYLLLWLSTKDNFTAFPNEIPSNKGELRTAARKLCERDYLLQQSDGSYHLRMALMGEWLMKPELDLEKERLGIESKFLEESASTNIFSRIEPLGLCVDLSTGQIYIDGQPIKEQLSSLRFKALIYLIKNIGRIVSRQELFDNVYGETYISGEQSLDTLILRIRQALNDNASPHKYLETLRGRGFRMKNASLVHTRERK